MKNDLTKGPVMKTMLLFAIPMILGNLLQQCYNVADTLIVGRFLGPDALAAVGSSYTLMTFLTSILLGLSMGSGTVFAIRYGQGDEKGLKEGIYASFFLLFFLTLLLNVLVYVLFDPILAFLQVPQSVMGLMKEYLSVIFAGLFGIFLYNYFAAILRAAGNSLVPLLFLAVSAVLNIVLDLWFVLGLSRGVKGAAEATILSQYVSGIGIALYTWLRFPGIKGKKEKVSFSFSAIKEIFHFSAMTCIQQSIMNLGILMVQGLVNSFGPTVMAAFAAGVKIDSFAYMPVQDFGNAFSTFIAQNYGAGKRQRIQKGLRGAVFAALCFCILITGAVWAFAPQLMTLFIDKTETPILAEGVRYLRIEGAFYCGIGCLFLLYGLYRAIGRPGMSVVLTVISLGTRVVLAYFLSGIPFFGVSGIWWSVPIGWFLADVAGLVYYWRKREVLFPG